MEMYSQVAFEQTGEIKRGGSNVHATRSLLEMQLQVHPEFQRRRTGPRNPNKPHESLSNLV